MDEISLDVLTCIVILLRSIGEADQATPTHVEKWAACAQLVGHAWGRGAFIFSPAWPWVWQGTVRRKGASAVTSRLAAIGSALRPVGASLGSSVCRSWWTSPSRPTAE